VEVQGHGLLGLVSEAYDCCAVSLFAWRLKTRSSKTPDLVIFLRRL